MEYLMTYGWAILIIAVVLGALFSLGVFNGANFAPKAPPGACQVFRPNGPGSTSFINLEGVCSGELPQYAAQFNGTTSVVTIQSTSALNLQGQFTLAVWEDTGDNIANIGGAFISKLICSTSCAGWGFRMDNGASLPYLGMWLGIWTGGAINVETKTWDFATFVYNGNGGGQFYFNGAADGPPVSGLSTPSPTSENVYIGLESWDPTEYPMNGLLANVQVYNTSLSANEIQALYLEGIGGAPIDLQNLVGWWPLNGNANDYSGNMNNGQATNVIYTSSWTNGYTAP